MSENSNISQTYYPMRLRIKKLQTHSYIITTNSSLFLHIRIQDNTESFFLRISYTTIIL